MRVASLAFWMLACGLTASPALAQQNPPGQRVQQAPSEGWWIGAGLGLGWGRVSCEFCRNERHPGATAHIRFARPLNSKVALGGEFSGWTHNIEEDEVRELIGAAQAVGYFYPRPNGMWYLKGGLGWMTYRADKAFSNGVGVQLGGGYEFPIGGGLTLTNYLSIMALAFSSIRTEDDIVLDDVGISLLQIGMGVTRR